MTSRDRGLSELRSAASRVDLNACRTATTVLLRGQPRRARSLAATHARHHLPAFERHHADGGWARSFLESLPEAKRLPDELSAEHPGPGGNNFARCIESLGASYATDDSHEVVEHAVDSVAEAIMAGAMAVGGEAHEELWRTWYQAALVGETLLDPNPLQVIMSNEGVRTSLREGWLLVAGDLDGAA